MTIHLAETIAVLAACGLMAAAILRDIATRTIPNSLCGLVALLGVALHLATGDCLAALGAALAIFGVAYFLWTRGFVGGGDVKLLAAAALLVPPGGVPDLVAATAMAGGVLGLIYLALGRVVRRPAGPRPPSLPARILRAERWRISRRGSLPYACAIAAGTFTVLLNG